MQTPVYLNNAATTHPKPEGVTRAVTDVIRATPFHHARTGFGGLSDCIRDTREKLALLFNVSDPMRICFSSGATESLNMVIRGLELQNSHVVTTAIEHNSVLRPLHTMEKQGVIRLTVVDCDEYGAVDPDVVEKAMSRDTKAVVINHCSNVTGVVNDIAAIGKKVKKYDMAFIVDASQSAGVYPIDIPAMQIDVLVFAGHKFLYGLQGIGGAYIGENVAPRPLKVGGTGVRSNYLFQPESIPMLYEAGTLNIPGIISLREGVDFILKTGMEVIRTHLQNVTGQMRQILGEHVNVRLYPSYKSGYTTTVFSFTIQGMDLDDIGYILYESFGIVVRTGLHCAPLIHRYIGTAPEGSVRISPSFFTTFEDIDVLTHAIKRICTSRESTG